VVPRLSTNTLVGAGVAAPGALLRAALPHMTPEQSKGVVAKLEGSQLEAVLPHLAPEQVAHLNWVQVEGLSDSQVKNII
jgi:hypothetical protein